MSGARIAVLASGTGTNLQSLLAHFAEHGESHPSAGHVALVASDRRGAGALERAARAGIPISVVRSPRAPDAPPLAEVLDAHRIDLVVLAGFLTLVPGDVTRAFAGRIVNVHPAPLPRFGGSGMYGLRVHRAVLASGEPRSGPTVHFVDDVYDRGPAIAHWPVPLLAGDDDHALAARVLRAEHLLYPRVVAALAAHRVRLHADGRVSGQFAGRELPRFDPALPDSVLAHRLDEALAR